VEGAKREGEGGGGGGVTSGEGFEKNEGVNRRARIKSARARSWRKSPASCISGEDVREKLAPSCWAPHAIDKAA